MTSGGAEADPAEIHGLGTKLRAIRRQKRLRLKDLAEQADCSMSMLSKIETERATPSLRILHRIANALDISISDLFSSDEWEEVTILSDGNRPTVVVHTEDGTPSIRLERLAPTQSGQVIDGNIHVLAPHADSGGDITHVGEEVGYILQGEVELFIAGHRYHLKQGDSFHFRSELPHSYRNLSDGQSRILWINTPPTF